MAAHLKADQDIRKLSKMYRKVPFKINMHSKIRITIYELRNKQFYELFKLTFGTSIHCSLVS